MALSSLTRRLFGACLTTATLATLATLSAAPAVAQTYLAHTVTMVVPWPAGGPSDFVARQIQPDMQKSLGQTLIVDNIGGVGGAMGVQKVLNAPADGYQLTLGSPLELIIAPLTLSTVKYKPEDMRLVAQMVRAPMVLIARKDLVHQLPTPVSGWAAAPDH